MIQDKYHEELDALKDATVEMGEHATGMLEDATTALKELDKELAAEVVSRKTALAQMDLDIEQDALRLIALHQPMAVDMRTIACILKTITYLNRLGRYGKDIAQLTIEMVDEPHVANLVGMPDMARRVRGMIRDALRAFREHDIAPLEGMAERDDEIDAMRWSIFRECLTYMMENPKNIARCANYMIIARYLERCGDHACKVAEKVNYMVTGEHAEIK